MHPQKVSNFHSQWECDNEVSAVFYTFFGIILAIVIELVNLTIGRQFRSPQGITPISSPETRDETSAPVIRTKRLIFSTIFFIPLLTLFILRVTPSCGSPNGTLVLFFNVIPLLVGITAWLRALVDCILLRYGRTLPYPSRNYPMTGIFGWPPFAPFYMVYLFIAIWVYLLVGPRESGEERRGVDLEGQGEERARLVGASDEDGIEDESLERPPPYQRVDQDEEAERREVWNAPAVKVSD